jgi:hypothetical protein
LVAQAATKWLEVGRARAPGTVGIRADFHRKWIWSATWRVLAHSGVQTIWTRCFGCRLMGRSHPHRATLMKKRRFLSRDNPCPCANRRCEPHTDAFRADFYRFDTHTGVVAWACLADPNFKAQRVGWAKAATMRRLIASRGGAAVATRARKNVHMAGLTGGHGGTHAAPILRGLGCLCPPNAGLHGSEQDAPQFFSSSSRLGHSRMSARASYC